jgi:hypothetical protein
MKPSFFIIIRYRAKLVIQDESGTLQLESFDDVLLPVATYNPKKPVWCSLVCVFYDLLSCYVLPYLSMDLCRALLGIISQGPLITLPERRLFT